MAIRGVLCKKAVAQTSVNASAGISVTWDTNVYDTEGLHDAPGASAAIVITPSITGLYGVFTAFFSLSNIAVIAPGIGSGYRAIISKNSSTAYIGFAAMDGISSSYGTGLSATDGWLQVTSPPVLLTNGDSFTVTLISEDTSITINAESSFGLYVVDQANGTHRCLATSAGTTGSNFSTPTVITFDGADTYDTDAIHAPGSSKLIIPAGLDGLSGVVFGQVVTNSQPSGLGESLAIRRNGSVTYAGVGAISVENQNGANSAYLQTQTQVIRFNTGDEFELLFGCVDASVDIAAARLALWVYDSSAPESGTTATLASYNFDGTADSATKDKLLGYPLVISLRHESGMLYIRTNNGTEVAVASGDTSSLVGTLRLALSGASQNADIKVFEAATFNCVPPEGVRDSLEQNFMAHVGAAADE